MNTWGEGNVSYLGGVQNRFGGGVLWHVFPSPEFSTPLCFSLLYTALRIGLVIFIMLLWGGVRIVGFEVESLIAVKDTVENRGLYRERRFVSRLF